MSKNTELKELLKKFNANNEMIRWTDNNSEVLRMQTQEYLSIVKMYLEKYNDLNEADKHLIRQFMKFYQTINITLL